MVSNREVDSVETEDQVMEREMRAGVKENKNNQLVI